MTALDDLPVVQSFLGLDLRTGALIVAAICIVHPMAYGCSFFMSMSYLIVTIWILVALFFAASIGLFFGVARDDALLCHIWIWYALMFVAVMLMLMVMLALVFTSRRQRNRVCVTIFGMLWYIMTIYFILVVNSYRKQLDNDTTLISVIPNVEIEEYLTECTTSGKWVSLEWK
ncbi:uncharacterized protein LOC128674405 [Plodia interpunctella]|uniref:uncharacterized protein LOC128674405 n=1 Tax=Plodia interpunctella TaxID=58824 RepID=UPI002367B17F|nr:uncharacterized protein LOC128674405 [Plodia interpunctella]